MSELDIAIEMMGDSYLDISHIAETTGRIYGLSADDVLAERERRQEILDGLQVLFENLSDMQTEVLIKTGAGVSVTQIAEEMGVTPSAVTLSRKSISTTLYNLVDEDRIQFLKDKIARLSKTSRGRHSQLYSDLSNELEKRLSVREAMKKLFTLLMPPQSTKEIGSGMSMPAYSFERAMAVGEGMREGIDRGHKVMKTVIKCHVPEYLNNAFRDDTTCCTLCATCSRKKDVVGRRGHTTYGLANH